MIRMFLLKKIFILIYSIFAISLSVSASSEWTQKVDRLIINVFNANFKEKTIYVEKVFDSSQDHIYLPFSSQIDKHLISSIISNGALVTSNYLDANLVLTVSYIKSLDGLLLYGGLTNKVGAKISSNSILLESKILPKSWNSRSLKDIAYEVSGVFGEKLLGQKIDVVMSGLSGGETKDEDFISDFTVAMSEYMTEELNTLPSILIKKKSRHNEVPYIIKGKFRVNGDKISLNYQLLKRFGGVVVASVSTKFTMDSIPQGMLIYPSNRSVAKSAFDDSISNLSNGIPVDLWINHANGVYKNNDRLEVSIRPNVDTYVRTFYVMSDGVICQIQPTSLKDSGFLTAGTVHTIGSENDDVELIITDDTIGQESIKVFASLTPIEERFLPTKYVEGVDYACTGDGYKSLKSGITRGLAMNQSTRPVNEIKILVK